MLSSVFLAAEDAEAASDTPLEDKEEEEAPPGDSAAFFRSSLRWDWICLRCSWVSVQKMFILYWFRHFSLQNCSCTSPSWKSTKLTVWRTCLHQSHTCWDIRQEVQSHTCWDIRRGEVTHLLGPKASGTITHPLGHKAWRSHKPAGISGRGTFIHLLGHKTRRSHTPARTQDTDTVTHLLEYMTWIQPYTCWDIKHGEVTHQPELRQGGRGRFTHQLGHRTVVLSCACWDIRPGENHIQAGP